MTDITPEAPATVESAVPVLQTTTTVITKDLITALKLVKPAVKTGRTMLPVLETILVEANAERQTLTLSATNLETGLVRIIPANVSENWSLCLPWRDLKGFVMLKKTMLDETCELIYRDYGKDRIKTCAIVFKTGSLLIDGIDPDEFPVLPTVFSDATCFDLPAQATADALRRVYQSCAQDDLRPALHGVSFTIAKGVLTLGAANGFMLAIDRVALGLSQKQHDTLACRFIMPYQSVHILLGLLDALETDTLPVQLNQFHDGVSTQLLIAWSSTGFSTRLIDARFPDLERVISNPDSGIALIANRHQLLAALENLTARARKYTGMIGLLPVLPTGNQPAYMLIQVRGDNSGRRFLEQPLVAEQIVVLETCHMIEPPKKERLADVSADGPLFPYGINIDLLLTQIKAIDSDLVNIAWSSVFHPMKITSVGGTSRHVIMPMAFRV